MQESRNPEAGPAERIGRLPWHLDHGQVMIPVNTQSKEDVDQVEQVIEDLAKLSKGKAVCQVIEGVLLKVTNKHGVQAVVNTHPVSLSAAAHA
jgi:hypothetical protein